MEISNRSIQLRALDLSWNPLEKFSLTADVLPNLHNLNLSYCGRNGSMKWDVVDKSFLSGIYTLDLSGIKISLDTLSIVLHSFRNSSLASLALSHLRNNTSDYVDHVTNTACHIPNLHVLRLEKNNISFVSERLLQSCIHTKKIDLGDSNISNMSESSFRSQKMLGYLRLEHNNLSSVPKAIRNLHTLRSLDLCENRISSLICSDFVNLTELTQLYLYNNNICELERCVFEHLHALKVLKLGGNHILTLNGAFSGLQRLEILQLQGNKLSSIKKEEFENLKSLKHLYLYDNQITSMEDGAFEGIINLTNLELTANKITSGAIRDNVFKGLSNLRRLSISSNRITYKQNSKLTNPPFYSLSSLESLDMFSQRPDGMHNLPSNFLDGLTALVSIRAGNINIKSLHPDTFKYTPNLRFLDISNNIFTTLAPELFHPLPNLSAIYLSKCRFQSLDFLIKANLSKVFYLQISHNELTVINDTLMHSLPSLTYLDMNNNSFRCDCSNVWFIQWVINNNQTQVVNAHQYLCKYPLNEKGSFLLDIDIHSCSGDLSFFYFISTTSLVLLTLLGSFMYHLLRWQMIYAYYLFLAYLYNTKRRNVPAANQYDAFVSYNTHDEPWVLGELLPELEGQQGWRLCLHHRDFQPGKPIIENITDAIYGSRKTICVISRHYLESEWCSREIQVASFRLFDEQKDVLILLFLEEIPDQQLSPYHRMRKLLKRRTYLSWPRAGEHTGAFWQKLRVALETRDCDDENPILTGVE
ncbi:hypothetical protein UPYG_G00331610 [Umbra pygmaea]|uniref:TIR domain-containing protein n=1 Tax=Umbra pygmaea TaxID=75934 RepID=A0ABD0VZM9_UMBPY